MASPPCRRSLGGPSSRIWPYWGSRSGRLAKPAVADVPHSRFDRIFSRRQSMRSLLPATVSRIIPHIIGRRDPMDGDPRVRQLLEELLDSEQTPEEVCHHCPELLPEVHRRWQRDAPATPNWMPFSWRRSPTRPSAAHRRRRPRPNCPGSRVMKSWRWWAAAAWASSTGPGTCARPPGRPQDVVDR